MGFGVSLPLAAPLFDLEADLGDGRSLWLAAGLSVAGACFAGTLPSLIARRARDHADAVRGLLWLIIAAGLAARALQFGGNPILEDDYRRYLWDGAVAAHGLNPYAISPADALQSGHKEYRRLVETGRSTLDAINHPELKTVYPPVAQAAFATAHAIAPFSLASWRLICLAGEIATLVLILQLLTAAGRSPLWVAVYWWNPLVIKELANSAHMDAVVAPLALAALLLSVRRRPIAATTMLGLAAGAKLWPLLLAPLILRPLWTMPRQLAFASLVLIALIVAFSAPVLLGGLDAASGFVAYAQTWQTNSALFPLLKSFASAAGLDEASAGRVVRVGLALLIGGVAIAAAWRPITDAGDLMRRATLIVAAIVLLSPAQFPWYIAWLAPFLCFVPLRGLLAMTALTPLYYAAFHFHANGAYPIFRDQVVWLIWAPVWILITADIVRSRRATGLVPSRLRSSLE